MIVILQFEPTDEAEFTAQVDVALRTLAARPGFTSGSAGRSIDEPRSWVVVIEWDTVGSYRRALGNYDVKLSATPLLAQALDRPSAFEQLRSVAADGTITTAASDRAASPPLRREQPRRESPRLEQPRLEQPRREPPRLEQPRLEQPRLEPPRLESPRLESPRLEPPGPTVGADYPG